MESRNFDVDDGRLSIQLLRPKSRQLMSSLLNGRKRIPSPTGVLRDWRGLMDLCRIGGQYTSKFRSSRDPTEEILQMWSQDDSERATIANLISILEQMDRFDVIADMTPLLIDDIQVYKSSPFDLAVSKPPAPDLSNDKDILTTDDVLKRSQGLPLENYDAFVLFADDDIDFATELINTLEKEYQMRFCVKDRDLVGGGLEYDKIIKSISERCNRLIVILSDSFFDSPANRFYLSFAQAYGIEKQRKVIPCLYKECKNFPEEMKCYYCLDYRRAKTWDFWSRLHSSLTVVPHSVHDVDRANLNRSRTVCNKSMHHENELAVAAKPLQVKFRSESDLINGVATNSKLSDDCVTPSTSTNGNTSTKQPNWLKKMSKKVFHRSNTKVDSSGLGTRKEKKNSLTKHIGRKVPTAMTN